METILQKIERHLTDLTELESEAGVYKSDIIKEIKSRRQELEHDRLVLILKESNIASI